jgi:hypothetical protein
MSSGSLIKYPLSNKVLGFGSRCQGFKKKVMVRGPLWFLNLDNRKITVILFIP